MSTEITQKIINQGLEYVEKQLKYNLDGLKWQIDNIEDLRTVDGIKVKIYFGTTSGYGGVTVVSLLSHGGGYVPYYIKLTEISYYQTEIKIIINGTETTYDDYGNRNKNIMLQLIEMCEKDCTNRTFKEKVKSLFIKE